MFRRARVRKSQCAEWLLAVFNGFLLVLGATVLVGIVSS